MHNEGPAVSNSRLFTNTTRRNLSAQRVFEKPNMQNEHYFKTKHGENVSTMGWHQKRSESRWQQRVIVFVDIRMRNGFRAGLFKSSVCWAKRKKGTRSNLRSCKIELSSLSSQHGRAVLLHRVGDCSCGLHLKYYIDGRLVILLTFYSAGCGRSLSDLYL